MKILLLGVFAHGSTDVWKATALRRAGHRVFPFPYRERDWRELFPLGEAWDLVIVSKGVPLPIEAFQRLSEISKARVLYWPDPFENWTPLLTEVLLTGAWPIAATSSTVLDRIWPPNPHLLPEVRRARILEGADCEGPMPGLWTGRVEPALLHFGHLSERRKEVISRLTAAGVPVHHLDRPLFGAELQREVLRHAAVLGINSSPDLYSNRVQTVLAMGGRIVQESAPGLWDDFGEHNALLPWKGDTSLIGQVNLALKYQREGWRPDEATGRLTYAEHSWSRWAERVLEFACPAEVRA